MKSRLRRPGRVPVYSRPLFVLLIASVALGLNSTSGASVPADLTWTWTVVPDEDAVEILAPGGVKTRIIDTDADPPRGVAPTTRIEQGSAVRTLEYDTEGRLAEARGDAADVRFAYNGLGLPSEVRTAGLPVLRYEYDVQDRLEALSIGDVRIRYRYDYLGRLAGIGTPIGESTYGYYLASAKVVRQLPNRVKTFRLYDDEGKLSQLIHGDAENKTIASYRYAYRPNGLIETIDSFDRRQGQTECRYDYDAMQRLTDLACARRGREYRYRYNYDSHGNLVESQSPGGRPLRFTNAPTGLLITDSRGPTRADERGHIGGGRGGSGRGRGRVRTSGDISAYCRPRRIRSTTSTTRPDS